MRNAGRGLLAALTLCLLPTAGNAAETSFCVTCSAPQKTYVCNVSTPSINPGNKALQLYCMMKTAKDGGHRSCSAKRKPSTQCTGAVKNYTFDGSGKLPGVRSAVRQYQGRPQIAAPQPPAMPAEPKKPKTLFGMTSNAVKSTGRGVKKTGDAVVKVTKGAGQKVGNAGSKIGNAARSAFDCVKKLFRSCGKDESEETAAELQPVPLTPEGAKPQ